MRLSLHRDGLILHQQNETRVDRIPYILSGLRRAGPTGAFALRRSNLINPRMRVAGHNTMMNLKSAFESDDRAVSPVIGVILMVAITVILAAVIGTFVLGLGDSLGDSQPTAQFSVDFDSSTNNTTIEHSGGDQIDSDELEVIVSDPDSDLSANGTVSRSVSVGDTLDVNLDDGSDNTDTPSNLRVRVIHQPSDSILLDRTQAVNGDVTLTSDELIIT